MKVDTSNALDLRRFLREIKSSWWLFAACFIFFCALAVFYGIYKMPTYNSKALVMIDQEDDATGGNALGGIGGVARMFSIGGLGGASAANEALIMKSNEVIGGTVKDLGLNRIYIENDGIKRKLLYGNSPLRVEAPEEFFDTLQYPFRLNIALTGNKADIELIAGSRFMPKKLGEYKNRELPTVINTIYGPLTILEGDEKNTEKDTRHLTVNVSSNERTIVAIDDKLEVDVIDKMADGISYVFQDPSKERGRAIINSLISQYEAKRLNQRHKHSSEQVEFYDGRIAELFSQLNDQEADIEKYKEAHNLTAVEAEAEVLAQSRIENQVLLAQLQSQLTFYQQVLSILEHDPDGLAIIAPNDGSQISNPLIEQYNTAVLEKRALEMSVTENNVALKQQKELIAGMRKSLLQNARLMIEEAKIGLEAYYALDNKADSRLREMPGHERQYVKMLRDQTILSELYLYLISQRESAAMDKYSTSVPGFVVDAAYSEIKSDKTKFIIVCVICLFLAIFCPTVYVFWKFKRKDRLKEPMDLASMRIEDHTVVFDGESSQLADMRNKLSSNVGLKEVLVADFTDSDALGRLANSFMRAGMDTYDANLTQLGFQNDNDSLVNPELHRVVEENAAAEGCRLAFVTVPDVERLPELADAVNSGDRALLLIMARESMKVSRLRRLLKGMSPDNVYLMLV